MDRDNEDARDKVEKAGRDAVRPLFSFVPSCISRGTCQVQSTIASHLRTPPVCHFLLGAPSAKIGSQHFPAVFRAFEDYNSL